MKNLFTLPFAMLLTSMITAQDLPYQQIPDAPEAYTAGSVMSRMIDGLGYRYYWATADLTDKNLDYTPGNEGRNTRDVLHHLHGLSQTIVNTAQSKANIRPQAEKSMTWEETRKTTLDNLKTASDILRSLSDEDISTLKIEFKRGDKSSSYDLWLLLNGPIADAMTHVGQIVSYRRSDGNPISSKVNVFTGKNRK